jgi:hypothetical protein
MLKASNYARRVLPVIVAILIAWDLLAVAACIGQQIAAAQANNHAAYNNQAACLTCIIGRGPISFILGFLGGTNGFIAITAIATGFIAWFTYTLQQATVSLSDRQSNETKMLQRAFISVEPGGIRPFGGGDDRIACDVLISNAGNLAARNLGWVIEKKYSADMAEKDFPIPSKLVGDIVIAPRGAIRKGSEPTTCAEFDKVRLSAKPDRGWLYVWGRVGYHDGFRADRYIDFCHRYNLRGSAGYSVPKENGRYHEYGNRTDEG